MRKSGIRYATIGLVTAFFAQVVLLKVTDRQVRLSSEVRQVYIFEGDLVSTKPPKTADEAAKTIKRDWLICRYWNGLRIKTYPVPGVEPCPFITP
jgi:hypothetical protein